MIVSVATPAGCIAAGAAPGPLGVGTIASNAATVNDARSVSPSNSWRAPVSTSKPTLDATSATVTGAAGRISYAASTAMPVATHNSTSARVDAAKPPPELFCFD